MDNTAELEINLYPLPDVQSQAAAAPGAPGAPAAPAAPAAAGTPASPPPPLAPAAPDVFLIEMRFNDPRDPFRLPAERGWVKIPFSDFEAIEKDFSIRMADKGAAHGSLLSKVLFDNPALKNYLDDKRSRLSQKDQAAQPPQSTALRVVLNLDPDSPRLHSLRWETLCDYVDQNWLLTKQNIWFSRFLKSPSLDFPSLRPRQALTALVAVANPKDLADAAGLYNSYPPSGETLHPIDADGEVQRARAALGIPDDPQRLKVIGDGQDTQPVSLKRLSEALQEGWDIVYLACHGAMDPHTNPPSPVLLLEDETTGDGELVPADELVVRLRQIPPNRRPRLILLASCQSAGTGAPAAPAPGGGAAAPPPGQPPAALEPETSDAASALQALGPKLAALGIPAVIAMQGKITMTTVASFMPKFFSELAKHGQVDLAMTIARGEVQARPDAWMPVLYLGLKDGRIWYDPLVYKADQQTFINPIDQAAQLQGFWNTLKGKYRNKLLTPVIGPGLSERILGPRDEFTADWAERIEFPLDETDRDKLEQVSLFYAADKTSDQAHYDFVEALRQHTLQRSAPRLGPPDQASDLSPLLKKISDQVWDEDPGDPLFQLAGMDFGVFITTCQDTLLTKALVKHGKQPQPFRCQWKRGETAQDMTNVSLDDPTKPVVFYLFGNIEEPESLVLSLDDVLDYLIYVTKGNRIPEPIWRVLTQRSALFLGFDGDEWGLRTLLRSIINSEAIALFKGKDQVAVQIEPREERLRSPAKARRYLERTLEHTTSTFNVFWFRAEDFIANFQTELNK